MGLNSNYGMICFQNSNEKNETCQTTAEAPWHHVCEAAQASKSSEGAKQWGNWQGSLPKRYHQLHKWSTWLYSFFRGSGFQSKHLYTCNFFSLTEVYDFTTVFFWFWGQASKPFCCPYGLPQRFHHQGVSELTVRCFPDSPAPMMNKQWPGMIPGLPIWMIKPNGCTT